MPVLVAYIVVALLALLHLVPDFQARIGGSHEPPQLCFLNFWH